MVNVLLHQTRHLLVTEYTLFHLTHGVGGISKKRPELISDLFSEFGGLWLDLNGHRRADILNVVGRRRLDCHECCIEYRPCQDWIVWDVDSRLAGTGGIQIAYHVLEYSR